MKKYLLMLLMILPTYVSAVSKDTLKAVTMVSYEQSWSDFEGTLALRNNTNEEIHNITFLIKYLDMNGNDLDYAEYTRELDIAPGMTKKIDIPAYEHRRQYSYYKSEAIEKFHRFKISFSVKSYNDNLVSEKETIATRNYYTPRDVPQNSGTIDILSIIVFIGILGFYIGLYVLVATMAQQRNRNTALWVLVSIFATPLLAIIILLCLGNNCSWKQEE